MAERRRVVLLRHGRTAWNAERRFQGGTDIALDEVGVAQARAAAEELARLRPVKILSSDASRARQTADELTVRTGAELVVDPRLREADLGAWEGLTRDDVKERFPDDYAAWRLGTDIRRGGGETHDEVAQRATPAVTDHLQTLPAEKVLVVVTHGGTAKALLGSLLQLPPAMWRSLASAAHGRWSVLEEMPFGWRLDEHNGRPRRVPGATGGRGV
jgi:glucosyl-3-phosphoglycerate phosphatase